MKNFLLVIVFISLFPSLAHSNPSTKTLAPIPCCETLEYRMQLDKVAKRNDMKGIAYLYDQKHCIVIPMGTEYSVLKILNEYSKIRVYINNKGFEVWAETINVP